MSKYFWRIVFWLFLLAWLGVIVLLFLSVTGGHLP
jgi:hypothetical protein